MSDSKLFNWCKLLIENKWLILALIGFFTSATGNVLQDRDIKDKDETLTLMADSYRTVVYNQTPERIESTKPAKCQCDMKAHIREYH